MGSAGAAGCTGASGTGSSGVARTSDSGLSEGGVAPVMGAVFRRKKLNMEWIRKPLYNAGFGALAQLVRATES